MSCDSSSSSHLLSKTSHTKTTSSAPAGSGRVRADLSNRWFPASAPPRRPDPLGVPAAAAPRSPPRPRHGVAAIPPLRGGAAIQHGPEREKKGQTPRRRATTRRTRCCRSCPPLQTRTWARIRRPPGAGARASTARRRRPWRPRERRPRRGVERRARLRRGPNRARPTRGRGRNSPRARRARANRRATRWPRRAQTAPGTARAGAWAPSGVRGGLRRRERELDRPRAGRGNAASASFGSSESGTRQRRERNGSWSALAMDPRREFRQITGFD